MVGPGGRRCRRPSSTPRSTICAPTPAIWEVILTGGDPLMLSPRRLAAMIARARSHPACRGSCAFTPACRSPTPRTRHRGAGRRAQAAAEATYVVAPRQPSARTDRRPRGRRWRGSSTPASRWSARPCCSKGVNDDAAILADADARPSSRCGSSPITCTTPISLPARRICARRLGEGQALMRALRGRVSGLCQPTYVLDMPGGHGKVPVGPSMRRKRSEAGGGGSRTERARSLLPPRNTYGTG